MNKLLVLLLSISTIFAANRGASTRYNEWFIDSDSLLWSSGENKLLKSLHPHPERLTAPVQYGSEKWIRIESNNTTKGNLFALKPDSTLWSWGYNEFGSLGHGGTESTNTPTQVGSSKWRDLSFVGYVSGGVKQDGSLWYWGDAYVEGVTASNTPTLLDSGNWLSIHIMTYGVLAIKADSTLWGLGTNVNGELGNGTVDTITTLTQIGSDKWLKLGGDNRYTIGIKADSTLWSWGRNDDGKVDSTTNVGTFITSPVQKMDGKFSALHSYNSNYYALDADSSLWFWGKGTNNIPINSSKRSTPIIVSDTLKVVDFSMGTICGHVQTSDNLVFGFGSLAYYSKNSFEDFYKMETNGVSAVQIETVNKTAYFLGEDSLVYGWGNNQNYRLGSTTISNTSVVVSVSDMKFITIFGGSFGKTLYALKADSSLWGLGANGSQELGQADTITGDQSGFVQIGTGKKWKEAMSTIEMGIALDSEGFLYTWGTDNESRLGQGAGFGDVSTPLKVGTMKWRDIAATEEGAAGLAEDSTFYGWGMNYAGGTIDSTENSYTVPTQQLSDRKWLDMEHMEYAVLLRAPDSTLWVTGEERSTFYGVTGEGYSISQLGTQKWLKYVAVADEMAVAIAEDSSLWGIGANVGQLMNSDSSDNATLGWTQIGSGKYVDIQASWGALIAQKDDGTIWVKTDFESPLTGFEIDKTLDQDFYQLSQVTETVPFSLVLNEDFGDTTISLTDYYHSETGFSAEIITGSSLFGHSVAGSDLTLQSFIDIHGTSEIFIRLTAAGTKQSIYRSGTVTITSVLDTTTTADTVTTVTDFDTVTTIDSLLLGSGDTLVTTVITEYGTDTATITTEYFEAAVPYDTVVTISISIDTLILSTTLDTLEVPVAILDGGVYQSNVDGLSIAPNPARSSDGKVNIIVNGRNGASVKISIFDVLGNLIDEQNEEIYVNGTHRFIWDLTNRYGVSVGSGSYVVIAVVTHRDGSREMFKKMVGVQW